jgi:CheY-like chemotaxis protein
MSRPFRGFRGSVRATHRSGRLMVTDELRKGGFKAIEARNADEAIALLQSQVPVDLVFTDVRLPGSIDGLTLAGLIRQTRPELRIIVVSGNLPAGSGLGRRRILFQAI